MSWFDLTFPNLSLPVADWVMSLEVGEHVPNVHEATLLRNLHAHNKCGIVLSWAATFNGNGHVNPHSEFYLSTLLNDLGYRRSVQWTDHARSRTGHTARCDKGNYKGFGGSHYNRAGHMVPTNLTFTWAWLRNVTVYERTSRPAHCDDNVASLT